jgi:hypothetical protein
MYAEIEQPDRTYELVDMHREPECGEAYCDTCGDCLHCYSWACESNDYCGLPRWVIYLENDLNPHKK